MSKKSNICTNVPSSQTFRSYGNIKLRGIRWARHVVRMGAEGKHIGFWWGNHKERDRKEDVDVGKNNMY
jgi:hypothetical protein